MSEWDREQEQYRQAKRDGEEMRALFIAAIVLAVLFALTLETCQRVFG